MFEPQKGLSMSKNFSRALLFSLALCAAPASADELLDFYGTIVKFGPGVMQVRQVDTDRVWNIEFAKPYPRGSFHGHFRSKQDFAYGYQVHVMGHKSGDTTIIADSVDPPGHDSGNTLALAAPTEGIFEPTNFNVRGSGECFAHVMVVVEPQGSGAPPAWTVRGVADELGHFDIPIESAAAANSPLKLTVTAMGKYYETRPVVVQVVRTHPAPEPEPLAPPLPTTKPEPRP